MSMTLAYGVPAAVRLLHAGADIGTELLAAGDSARRFVERSREVQRAFICRQTMRLVIARGARVVQDPHR